MSHRPSVVPHPALFDRTVAGLSPRLARLRSPHQLMSTLRWGLAELDRALTDAPAELREAVACRAGCDYCCRVPVDVQAHEVLYAAHHILTEFAPAAIELLITGLATHRTRVLGYAAGERDTSQHPCVMLHAGHCTIYAGRPQPCRAHHTSDAATCAAHFADASIDITRVYLPALRARMFAVMLGVDATLSTAGYDERSYDFGSALHEALTNSECLDCWLLQQNAFGDDCLSDPAV